jgi:hypothetical protein
MADLDVRIERLLPTRVAWVRVVGCSPEQEAWSQLSAWARPMRLLDDPVGHPVFGFNSVDLCLPLQEPGGSTDSADHAVAEPRAVPDLAG